MVVIEGDLHCLIPSFETAAQTGCPGSAVSEWCTTDFVVSGRQGPDADV